MPLAEVKEYIQLVLLGQSTIPKRYQLIRNQVQKAEQERTALEKRVNFLKNKEQRYNGLLQAALAHDRHQAQTKKPPETTGKRSSSLPA